MTTRFECGYPDQRRDGYNDRDYREPKWHPGQVVPGQFLNRVVSDLEEGGLSRPPSSLSGLTHQRNIHRVQPLILRW